VAETTVADVMAELAALEDPRARAVNEKRGDVSVSAWRC
jgi:hypothetical protein